MVNVTSDGMVWYGAMEHAHSILRMAMAGADGGARPRASERHVRLKYFFLT